MSVAPKKHLGQHFLTNQAVCKKIVDAIPALPSKSLVLEIGPGKGAITQFLLERNDIDLHAFEIDMESVNYLHQAFPQFTQVHLIDFLKADLRQFFEGQSFSVVGNFPYNISSQIVFKCLENRRKIPLILGMFQKEVAKRIAETPGSKEYGILSVLVQAFYEVKYLFSVEPGSFFPPPKVVSGVIRCTRNDRLALPCDEGLFVSVVKTAFNQRRKTLRNSLKALTLSLPLELAAKRPEQLSVEEYIYVTQFIEQYGKK
ncbi:MAG: 16S rRNA (adenine(1518)-N(6)/adenine(1519)-N(6))-dimethyltransferase RsmA [Bacteroidetes bacterium]|nr:16S rRNA (adenine(1518)-N(6)/adenine(1519)-N(6))-dimethyltransferase RsmA [Bacteroidota bacterium]